jgi:hypothetical protein
MLVRDAGGVEEDLYSCRFTLGYVSANLMPYAQLPCWLFVYICDRLTGAVIIALPTVNGFVFRVS